MKIMRNSKSSNHCYVIFDHQSVKQQKLSYQHKSIVTAILPTHSNTSNSKIRKFHLFCFKRNLAAPRYSSNNLSSSNSVTTRQNANEFASALAAQSFGSTLGLHKLSTLRFVQ